MTRKTSSIINNLFFEQHHSFRVVLSLTVSTKRILKFKMWMKLTRELVKSLHNIFFLYFVFFFRFLVLVLRQRLPDFCKTARVTCLLFLAANFTDGYTNRKIVTTLPLYDVTCHNAKNGGWCGGLLWDFQEKIQWI